MGTQAANLVALHNPDRTASLPLQKYQFCFLSCLYWWYVFCITTEYWDMGEFLFANQAQFFNSVFFNKTASDL